MTSLVDGRLARVQARVAAAVGQEEALLVGRGATAIYLALKSIESERGSGEVVVPAIGCASLAEAVVLAGFLPRYTDVDPDSFTLSPTDLARVLTPMTRAVLAVHIFGHACDMAEISRIAEAHGVPVIEDVAQALGGRFGGVPLGHFGEFCIGSFGRSKLLDAGGGGFVAASAGRVEALARLASQLPPPPEPESYALRAGSKRNLYHAMVDLLRDDPSREVAGTFDSALGWYADMYNFQFVVGDGLIDRVETLLAGLDETNARRVARAQLYEEMLPPGLQLPRAWKESGTVWRYSMVARSGRDALRVATALRGRGKHASNQYWSLADLFRSSDAPGTASMLSPLFVNVWVDETATPDYVRTSCETIASVLETPDRDPETI